MNVKKTKYFLMGLLSATAVVYLNVSATGAPVANIFNAGQTAVAADVNANFQELADRIDTVNSTIPPAVATYDYHNYIPAASVTQKVFSIDGVGSFDQETRNFTTGATSRTIVQIRTLAAAPARWNVLVDSLDAEYLSRDSNEVYDATGAVLQSTSTLDDDIELLASTMQVGSSWGGSATVTDNPDAGVVVATMAQSTLLAVEDITVTAGSYTGCLKISSSRYSGGSGHFGNNIRVTWNCPGVGMVKRIRVNHDGSGPAIWELTSISP